MIIMTHIYDIFLCWSRIQLMPAPAQWYREQTVERELRRLTGLTGCQGGAVDKAESFAQGYELNKSSIVRIRPSRP